MQLMSISSSFFLYRVMVHTLTALRIMVVTTVAIIVLTIQQVPMDMDQVMAACCTKSYEFDKKIHFPTHCLSAFFGLPGIS